jgi:hypothetical protein
MRLLLPSLLSLLLAWVAVPPSAAAQVPATADVVSYAIVVGSNAGGPGQDGLRFAEDDARRVAEVLRDLGGYERDHVRMVLAPTPGRLLSAIDQIAEQVKADSAAGRRSLVFFYYSGHARAQALVLGDAELELTELRARITALPADVTVVVLDACQSGAFTRVKGAEPAADFSFNSRTGLDAEGMAVLASSSESELSQESDFLEGSYFTHHLLVGLRGGGDRDKDGRVSLDEAYQYAYHQTLVATSHTAVGRQHVSFEADLRGQGEVTLTYPDEADASITLAAAVTGDVLIQRLPAEAVLAEVHKSPGEAVTVAIPAGKYRVLVRTAEVMHRCPVSMGPGGTATVDLTGCDEVSLVDAATKGGGGPVILNPWAVTLSFSLGGARDDAHTQTLEDFDYHGGGIRSSMGLGLVRRVAPHLAVTGTVTRIGGETWTYDTELEPMTYSVTSHLLTIGGRAELASADDGALLYAEAGAGVTWSRDRFEDEMDVVTHDSYFGAHLTAGAGAQTYPGWLGGNTSIGFDARWIYAPTVENNLGDTMDVGSMFFGVSFGYRP